MKPISMVAHSQNQPHRISFGFLCALILASSCGCQFAPQNKKSSWAWQKETESVIPDRILPVWTDSILHQPGQPGVRGFGGRVYFYGKDKTDPIEVDGSFAVYVFDADDNAPNDQKPLRKFMFTADQFKTHMSKTSMGPSYSVWVPWGEVGGAPRRLSLISRFEGREGGTTISDPTIKMLPGIPTNQESASTKGQSVTLAAHVDASGGSTKKEKQDDEDTVGSIDLPPAFQRHLRSPVNSFEQMKRIEKGMLPTQPSLDVSTPAPKLEVDSQARIPSKSDEPVIAPMTTQVYDYRTRGSQRATASSQSKPTRNIRDGRWIESISK